MWRPKDERQLLRFYYRDLGSPDQWSEYSTEDLIGCLVSGQRYDVRTEEYDREKFRNEISVTIDSLRRVDNANRMLESKGLIENMRVDPKNDAYQTLSTRRIKLTPDGYDLGRQYSRFFLRTYIFWSHFKHHWIVTILASVLSFGCGWLAKYLYG